MSQIHVASAIVPYTYSLRVLLSLNGGKVQVLKATRVAMRAPGSPPSPPAKEASGYWFEVRDKAGKLLYHRPLPHADMDSIEVFDDPKGGTIRRVPVTNPERKIELIIPDLSDASEFTLHGPEKSTERRKPSGVLDRHTMESLRGLAQGRRGASATDQGETTGNGGAK